MYIASGDSLTRLSTSTSMHSRFIPPMPTSHKKPPSSTISVWLTSLCATGKNVWSILTRLSPSIVSGRTGKVRRSHLRTSVRPTRFLVNDPQKALDYFQQAITKLELLNDRANEANTLELMGDVWVKLQKREMAVQSFQRSLFLYSRLGNTEGEASVRKQLRTATDPEAGGSPLSQASRRRPRQVIPAPDALE